MHRVVIVGGGFGGLQAALHLRRAEVDITLVDRRNFHLFQPLAYQVATGALMPGEVCYPLRAMFKRDATVRVLCAEVRGFDLAARDLVTQTYVGELRLPYDTLIVAGGSDYNYFGHPEWREHAAELKSLEGALHIEAGDRVLAGFPPGLSKSAARALESLGVTPMTGHMVTDLNAGGVVVRSGSGEERIEAGTIIWAAGVLASELAPKLAEAAGAETDKVQ